MLRIPITPCITNPIQHNYCPQPTVYHQILPFANEISKPCALIFILVTIVSRSRVGIDLLST